MATVAHFTIINYDGASHEYYRFLDGYPSGDAGVFQNFPLGDRDFCLETFERRLNLEKSEREYFVDVLYNLDLRTRTVQVSSTVFVEDINFKGSFEEAIIRFADEDYSEQDALESFPHRSDIEPIIFPGFLDGLWVIVKALKSNLSFLEYDIFSPRVLYIGDNINFYMYQDFILFPDCRMNRNHEAIEDAYANARRVGVRVYFNNTITNDEFTLLYMLDVERDGYILPLTGKFIRYGEGLDDKTKEEELAMLVKHISISDPKDLKARNYMYYILSRKEMDELKKSL